MATPRRKTGEPQKVRQPLKIDLLPESVRDAIGDLYARGRTWKEIEDRSALPYDSNWATNSEAGFVDWEKLDLKVLEAFPDMRIAKSTLQRWFDLRVRQARQQVLRESAQARAFAASFADKNLPEQNASVINALRDQVFGLMQLAGAGDKDRLIAGLNDLTLAMSRMQRVELQAKRVQIDRRRIKLLEKRESRARQAVDETTKQAAKKGTGQFSLDDINLLRERTFGLPPLQVSA